MYQQRDGKNGGNMLTKTIKNILGLCKTRNVRSVAMPAISTGIFGFPLKSCARVMAVTVYEFLDALTKEKDDTIALRTIRIVTDNEKKARVFADELSEHINRLLGNSH